MTNKKKVRALSPYTLLSYLFIITFVLTGVSFARFGNTKTAEDAARSATFEITSIALPDENLVSVYHSEDGVKTSGSYNFKITSKSEVPITYTLSTDTTDAQLLERGIELTLTVIYSDEDREKALAGKKIDGQSHTHRPDETYKNTDGTLGKHIHNFVGVGVAPAGTHEQEFVLNFHYTPAGAAGATNNVDFKIWDGIKLKVVANDAREGGTFRKQS